MTNRDRVTMCPVLLKHRPRIKEGQTYRRRDILVYGNSSAIGIGMTYRDRVTMCPVLLKHTHGKRDRHTDGGTYWLMETATL